MRGFIGAAGGAGYAQVTDKDRVATPTPSLAGGTYPADDYPLYVTFSCADTGATLYATAGASPPGPSNYTWIGVGSVLVGIALPPGGGYTIQVVAVKAGYNESLTRSDNYQQPVVPQCSTPTFSPVAGSYNNDQFPKSIAITSATSGSTIHYTTNGTTPTGASPSVANGGSVSVAANQTLKAIATKATYTDSTVASGLYTAVVYTCTAPSFSPVAGSYGDAGFPKVVTITSGFPSGVNIRYTLDGSTPSSSVGTLIASGGTASVGANQTLKAIAYKTAYNNSTVTSGQYVAAAIAAVTHTPDSRAYAPNTHFTVTIATATSGCTIRWTSDGSNPTATHGTLINASSGTTSSLNVGVNGNVVTVKSIAMKSGYNNTAIKQSDYNSDNQGGG